MTSGKLAGLVLLALSGDAAACATVAGEVATSPRAWPQWRRPVAVLVDAGMPSACIEAAFIGVSWWTDQGVDYLAPELVPSTHPAVIGVPRAGEVGITSGPLTAPAVGLTQWTAAGGLMHDAIVTLDFEDDGCVWQVAAHELGHALGLRDLYGREDWENVMLGVTLRRDTYVLTPKQLEQVR
jgi:hypothetical protein